MILNTINTGKKILFNVRFGVSFKEERVGFFASEKNISNAFQCNQKLIVLIHLRVSRIAT
jgi:hypothetical protein